MLFWILDFGLPILDYDGVSFHPKSKIRWVIIVRRAFGGCILTFAVACPFGSPPVQAQGPGLGGYGGMTYSATAGMAQPARSFLLAAA